MDLSLHSNNDNNNNINFSKFHFNRQIAADDLHSLPLTPPSPHSLDDPDHPYGLGHPDHPSLPPESSTPLQVVCALSRGSCSTYSLDWQPCTQPPQQPCSPVSMTGLESSPRDIQRHNFLPSPLLSDDLASSSENILYPSQSPAMLSTRSGLGTPPISTRSNSAEIDHPYRPGHSVYSPHTMSNDYLSGTAHSNNAYELVHSREPLRGSISYAPARTSPTHCSPGHSPRFPHRGHSPYLYSPYDVENRRNAPPPPPPPPPQSHEYHHTEMHPLPLPPTTLSKRNGEPMPPINYPGMMPPSPGTPMHPYNNYANHNANRYDDPWMSQPRGRSFSDGGVLEGCGSGFKCTRCRYTGTSQEQLTKHQQKHLKLHHCRFRSCSRTEGFATPNDRERHEKSIHKIPGQYWKCMDEHCSSYGKEFSRRDNLKDHLRRMHPVAEGMSENEAGAHRSKMADQWRFDKRETQAHE